MKHVKTNLDKLSKNVDQVSKLQRKDPDDKFEEVMSVFNDKADSEYNLCKVLKGIGPIPPDPLVHDVKVTTRPSKYQSRENILTSG